MVERQLDNGKFAIDLDFRYNTSIISKQHKNNFDLKITGGQSLKFNKHKETIMNFHNEIAKTSQQQAKTSQQTSQNTLFTLPI